jgi:hypothetical protein
MGMGICKVNPEKIWDSLGTLSLYYGAEEEGEEGGKAFTINVVIDAAGRISRP